MELHFLGRGAAFNTAQGNTSAYFVEKEKLFLIDCGESIFAKLQEEDIFSGIKEIYVVISHTHSDHCGSLGSLGLYCQFVLKNKLKIVVPHETAYVQSLELLMTLFGNTKNAYEFVYEENVDGIFEGFDSVRYELTKHDFQLTCFSFVFQTAKGGVFFSADTRTTENLQRFIEKQHEIDCIYMEVTDLGIPNDIHLNMAELEAVIPYNVRSKVRMMHLRSIECMKKLEYAGFQVVDL